jgi:hypothetical protein
MWSGMTFLVGSVGEPAAGLYRRRVVPHGHPAGVTFGRSVGRTGRAAVRAIRDARPR